MKTAIFVALLSLAFVIGSAAADDFVDTANVTSVRPITQRIVEPVRECHTEAVRVESSRERSIAGPVIGGIIGALAGSNIGGGNGKTAAAAAGAIAGTIVGDQVQNGKSEAYESTETPREICGTSERERTQTTGYEVTYEYQGHTFRTTSPDFPRGHLTVRVQVSPQRY